MGVEESGLRIEELKTWSINAHSFMHEEKIVQLGELTLFNLQSIAVESKLKRI